MLALVVGRDRAVRAVELAAEREHQRADRAVLSYLIGRQRRSAQGLGAAWWLEQAVAEHRVRQLIEIAEQSLRARVHEFFGDAVTLASRVHQPGDLVEHSSVAGADKRRSHGFAISSNVEQRFEQAEEDEF